MATKMQKIIYLDNASSTKLSGNVLKKISSFIETDIGNPSSFNRNGRLLRKTIEESRKHVADFFNCSPTKIFFTSGATESNNIIIKSALRRRQIKKIITSNLEHKSIISPVHHYAKEYNIDINILSNDNIGRLIIDNAHKKMINGTTLISLTHINNEIGTINPINELEHICNTQGGVLHVDAVQSLGYHKFDLSNSGIGYLSASGHKIHGPKGIGILYSKDGITGIEPLLHGGGQEYSVRAGTENLIGIIGIAETLKGYSLEIEKVNEYVKRIKKFFLKELKKAIPDIFIFENYEEESNNSVSIAPIIFPPRFLGLLDYYLDLFGIIVSQGSACNANTDSHVLRNLNIDKDNFIRFSFSRYTTESDIEKTVRRIKEIELMITHQNCLEKSEVI